MTTTSRQTLLLAVRTLTVVSLLAHALLAGWHGGAMASVRAGGAVATITICVGGVLQEVPVDADGVPVPGDTPELATSCPHCAVLASADMILPPTELAGLQTSVGTSVATVAFVSRDDRCPRVHHGQDPPFSS